MFGKSLNLLCQINFAIGQSFIVVTGRILNKLSSDLVTLFTFKISNYHFVQISLTFIT